MVSVPTNYANNAVACKLWGMLDSPIEALLGVAMFDELSHMYDGWRCWVYSEWEFETFTDDRPDAFALVPQVNIPGVGRVDFAILAPHHPGPVVVIECDGHDFHERTAAQASEDDRRDRALQRLGIPVLRFTGTDIMQGSAEAAREIAEFVDYRLQQQAARDADENELTYRRYGLP